jgi:putative ABC transport system ATP-binding protein
VTVLETRDVTKSFGSGDRAVTAVNGVTMTIADGEFVAIVGRSGSGKTTLMSLLGALEQPTKGMIFVDGEDITRLSPSELVHYRGRKIGFVFQSYNLVPNLSSTENVMLPMEFIGVGKAERKARATQLLGQVELTGDKQERKPGRLSGGEQQRVAIARALANKPSFILADEPAGNLDSQTSGTIVELLRSVSRSEGTTVISSSPMTPRSPLGQTGCSGSTTAGSPRARRQPRRRLPRRSAPRHQAPAPGAERAWWRAKDCDDDEPSLGVLPSSRPDDRRPEAERDLVEALGAGRQGKGKSRPVPDQISRPQPARSPRHLLEEHDRPTVRRLTRVPAHAVGATNGCRNRFSPLPRERVGSPRSLDEVLSACPDVREPAVVEPHQHEPASRLN